MSLLFQLATVYEGNKSLLSSLQHNFIHLKTLGSPSSLSLQTKSRPSYLYFLIKLIFQKFYFSPFPLKVLWLFHIDFEIWNLKKNILNIALGFLLTEGQIKNNKHMPIWPWRKTLHPSPSHHGLLLQWRPLWTAKPFITHVQPDQQSQFSACSISVHMGTTLFFFIESHFIDLSSISSFDNIHVLLSSLTQYTIIFSALIVYHKYIALTRITFFENSQDRIPNYRINVPIVL